MKHEVTPDQRTEIDVLTEQLKRKMGFKDGSPISPEEVIKTLQTMVDYEEGSAPTAPAAQT